MDAVLRDYRSSPICDREKALFTFVEKVNREAAAITEADVDAVRAAGWDDEAIYDAITVCALFNFYNRWNDAAGVQPMSEEDYAASGRRMAARGYLMTKT